jgi:hypothetical protein
MTRFRATNLVVRTRPRRGLLYLAACVPPAALFALEAWDPRSDLIPPLGLAFCAEALFILFVPVIFPNGIVRTERNASFMADEEGVTVGDELVLPRARIEAVSLEPRADETCVVAVLGHSPKDDLEVVVDGAARARALADALGIGDPTARRLGVLAAPLRRGARRALALALRILGGALSVLLVVALAMRSGVDALLFATAPALLVYGLVTNRFARIVDALVGADGIDIRSVRSIAWKEVKSVRGTEHEIRLALRNEEEVLLAFRDDAPSRARCAAALSMIQERLRALVNEEAQEGVVAALARSGREADAWLSDVRTRISGSCGTYRSSMLSPDMLWRVVEDPKAPPSARVAAAAMLGPSLDDDGKRRLRVAAESTALAGARDALAKAADGADDEEIVAEYVSRGGT